MRRQSGADFVKVNQRKPEGFDLKPGMRCASFDGDADRIVFWYADKGGTFIPLRRARKSRGSSRIQMAASNYWTGIKLQHLLRSLSWVW